MIHQALTSKIVGMLLNRHESLAIAQFKLGNLVHDKYQSPASNRWDFTGTFMG